jgi:hypothetical protein
VPALSQKADPTPSVLARDTNVIVDNVTTDETAAHTPR